MAVAVPRPLDVDEADIDTDSSLVLLHWASVPVHSPKQFHCHTIVVSATSSSAPAAQPFVTALLQTPFVGGVTVHVALAALLHVPLLQVNVADPLRQEAPFVRLTLAPELVVLAAAEQPLPHSSELLEQFGGGGGVPQEAVEPPHPPVQYHLQLKDSVLLEDPVKQELSSVPHLPFTGVSPLQDWVSRSAGLDVGHSVLPQGQVTVRVRI